MRRRPAPPPSAQQMIREYLGRVSVAATEVLPKGDRLLFVGRTRAAIEAKVGPLASADADDVLSALTALGEPEELAKRERERLYSARRRGAAAAPPALWKPSKDSRRGTVPPPPPPARRSGPVTPSAQQASPRTWRTAVQSKTLKRSPRTNHRRQRSCTIVLETKLHLTKWSGLPFERQGELS